MNKKNVINGAVLATAVAALIGSVANTSRAEKASGTASKTDGVKCQGINPCKGKAECKGAGHECGKHTPCKGKGWVTVKDADECKAKGGTVI